MLRYTKNSRQRAIAVHSAIALLLLFTMFISHFNFVETYILPKWYGFIFGTIILVLICYTSTTYKKMKISLDCNNLAVIIFLSYLLLRMSLSEIPQISILSLMSFTLLYLLFNIIKNDQTEYINILIVCICLIQAIYGIGQWVDIFYCNTSFKISGSFDNPAGFAACIASSIPFCFPLLNKSRTMKYIGFACLFILGTALVISESRAGIFAFIVIFIVYIIRRYKNIIQKHIKTVSITALLFVLIIMIGLVFLKKDSAQGRIAIWRNSIEMLVKKPILGYNPSGFSSNYMLHQANYFSTAPDSKYARLADNVNHPFNEYLMLAIEYGIIGLLLIIIVFANLLMSTHKPLIPSLCLLSIAIFSCFSYPLRYPFIGVLTSYSLACFSSQYKVNCIIHPIVKNLFLLIIMVIMIILIKDIRYEYNWGKLALHPLLNKKETLQKYYHLYKEWNGNPLFLYNFGAVLNQLENYEESNLIMNRCKDYLNDYDVQIIMGNNNFHLNQWDTAEYHYLIAHNMIPNRFLPLSYLMDLYIKKGDYNKARDIAKEIIIKDIKIPSTIIYNIINKAKQILSENNKAQYPKKSINQLGQF